MTRDELEHAIRASCDIAHDDEVYVFGSQAILGQFPDPPATLRMSAEADISPKNQTELADDLNVIGEDSQFHRLHGFYVHGISITEAAVLPRNWQRRTVRISKPTPVIRQGIVWMGTTWRRVSLPRFGRETVHSSGRSWPSVWSRRES